MTPNDVWSFFPEWFWWGFAALYMLTLALIVINAWLKRDVERLIAERMKDIDRH